MTNTSSNLPVCVHCGTQRPADETLCPNCGKPWIDVSVEDALATNPPVESDAAPAAAAVASSAAATDSTPETAAPAPLDETGEFDFDDWTLPPEPKRSKALWLVPVVLLIGVVALWLVVFVDRDDGPTAPSIATADTSSTLATTTTQASTTTAQASTTTTSTTIALYPPAESWKPVGDAVPTSALTLKAAGIGPVDFGTLIPEAAGALVASLGKAQDAGVDSDSCPSTEWYWLEWGDLRGIFDGYAQDAEFVAFQYESIGPDEPDPILGTLSGIQLGDTVEDLQKTYLSYTVSFEIIEGKDHFRLTNGGDLLLWGPVTSTDSQGTIQGIYSQDPCPIPN